MTKLELLTTLATGGELCARDVAVTSGEPESSTSSCLVKAHRAGLLARRRARRPGDSERWYYRLSEKGARRLEYLRGTPAIPEQDVAAGDGAFAAAFMQR